MAARDTIVREPLIAAWLTAAISVERVKAARIELGPRQETGPHRHPCDVVGLVTSGSIRFQPENEPTRLLGPGDAFHEPAGTTIVHFDNALDAEPATFVAFYLLPAGETDLIQML